MDTEKLIVLTEIAAGIYIKVEITESEHGYRNIVKGKKCYWCPYNTALNKYRHIHTCPTSIARKLLSEEKIPMKLWKIAYVFLQGELNELQQTLASAHLAYITAISEPTNREAELILTSRIKMDGQYVSSPHVISVSFSENIGYIDRDAE